MSTIEANQVRMTLRIPEELHASVKKLASDANQSVNSYIIKALSESVSRVDVPLEIVQNEDGDLVYVLPHHPWVYIEQIWKCGEVKNSTGQVRYCIDCHRQNTKEIEGCGKEISQTT